MEENYLFQKLMRKASGVNNVDHRVGMPLLSLHEEGVEPGMEIAAGDLEQLSYAALLGVDMTEEFPVLWLRLKQAINRGAQTLFMGSYIPEISPHLAKTVLHTPGDSLEMIRQHLPDLIKKGGKGGLLIGAQYLNSPHRKEILAELLKLRQAASDLSINILEG